MAISVNGQVIPDSLVEETRAQLAQMGGEGGVGEEVSDAELKEMLVDRLLLQQLAEERVPELPSGLLRERMNGLMESQGGEEEFMQMLDEIGVSWETFEKNLELQLKVDELIGAIVDELEEPTEDELEAYFEEHKADFNFEEMVIVANIVREVGNILEHGRLEQEMKELRKQIKNEEDFFAAAREHSDAGDEDCIAGPFPRGLMLPEYEDVAFNLAPREISEVFHAGKSFFIVMLIEKLPPEVPSFEEAVDDVEDAWYEEQELAVVDELVAEMRESAVIEEV